MTYKACIKQKLQGGVFLTVKIISNDYFKSSSIVSAKYGPLPPSYDVELREE